MSIQCKLILPIAALCTSFILSPSRIAARSWESAQGPEGGEARAFVQIADTLLVGSGYFIGGVTPSGGVFRSEDSGPWLVSNLGLPASHDIHAFAINSSDMVFVGAGSGGIYLSSDAGRVWSSLSLSATVHQLAIDASDRIYAGTTYRVYRSDNDGVDWTRMDGGSPPTNLKCLIAAKSGRILAGDATGVYGSIDNGDTWTQIGTWGNSEVRGVLEVGADSIIVGRYGGGVDFTPDGGSNWYSRDNALLNGYVTALAMDSSGNLYAGTTNSIYRSTDLGLSWSSVGPTAVIHEVYFDAAGVGWAGTNFGVFRSASGTSWTPNNTGYVATRVLSLAINSVDSVFAGTWYGGAYYSYATNSWTKIADQFGQAHNPGAIHAITAIGTDSVIAGTIGDKVHYSWDGGWNWTQSIGDGGINLVWSLASWPGGVALAGSASAGIYRSTDHGLSWVASDKTTGDIRDLAVDSRGRAYAGISGDGVWRSLDSGKTWTKVGLSNNYVNAVAIDTINWIVYAADIANGIYAADSMGTGWTQVGPVLSVSDLVVDGLGVLYAAGFGTGTWSGIWSMVDGVWLSMSEGLDVTDVRSLAINSVGDLYAGTNGSGVYISKACDDADNDWVCDLVDNCPNTINPDQADANGNSVGDACEADFTVIETSPADVVALATGDLDLDRYTDVVYAGDNTTGIFVAWGQTGSPPLGAGAEVSGISMVDANVLVIPANADSIPDIVAVTGGRVYSLINSGDRTFEIDSVMNPAAGLRSPNQSTMTYGTAPQFGAGFFNGDAYVDLVVSENVMLFGDGSGTFPSGQSLLFSFQSVAVSDFNEDGFDDLAILYQTGPGTTALAIRLNDGAATFSLSDQMSLHDGGFGLSSLTSSVDINLDNYADIVAVQSENSGANNDVSYITVATGNGTGGLALSSEIAVEGRAPQVSLIDVNRDYYLDIIVSNVTGGELQVYYGDGFGVFGRMEKVTIGVASDLMFALASADLDRDGQPDFISGSAAGENLVLSLNDLPDQPVFADELFVTGYDNVDIKIVNPAGFVISPYLKTVAGSAYYRMLVDANEDIDSRAYDFNLQYGVYSIEATVRPKMPANHPINMGIGIDGSQQATVALNYSLPIGRKSLQPENTSDFFFEYVITEGTEVFPVNGIPSGNTRPTFDWSQAVAPPTIGSFRFQMDKYHDLSSGAMIIDVSGLTAPIFRPDAPLDPDSVYYWRYLTSYDNGANFPDTSYVFAAYITEGGCCVGRVGDANGSGDDEPTIGDISLMIDAKFIANTCDGLLPCLLEADINQSGGASPVCNDITIGDISALIDYLFIAGPEVATLPDCL